MIETVWFMIFTALLGFLFLAFGVYTEVLWFNFIAGFILLIDGALLFTAPIVGVAQYFNYGLGITLCMAGILIALFSVLND